MSAGLEGKRVLITAGAAGIGRAITQSMADAGAKVFICDVDDDALFNAQAEIPGLKGQRADVSIEQDVDALFEAASATLGGLDILVNCAGISGPTAGIEDVKPAEWRQTLAVNLDGTYLCSRLAVPLLKAAGGGSIVNFSSTAGFMGYPRRTPYAAAKWAIIGLTKSLAMELGPFGVRVNAICPGSVEGDRMDRVIAADEASTGRSVEEIRRDYVRATSMRTFVSEEDIANMVLFVCSDAGSKISGQALAVDGHSEAVG